jgi:hypothetical protein
MEELHLIQSWFCVAGNSCDVGRKVSWHEGDDGVTVAPS